MSSTESSGAPAESTPTPPAQDAAFPSFGSTRGSGLARGKRPAAGPAASTAASTEYTPTAIEVVNAPREYQNPFAPVGSSAEGLAKAETPKPFEPAPVVITPAPARRERVAPVREYSAPAADVAPASAKNEEPAELDILEPAQPKVAPAQTWESEGFKPAREPRGDRPPRREERSEHREERNERPADEPVDLDSIPPQFLYVRPGHTYVPTPRNWGGAPRERSERTERSDRPIHGSPERALETSAEVPAKSGGFFGWLKSLFGGSSPEPVATPAANGGAGNYRRDGGGQRRHRGGRNRSGGQGGYSGGEGRGGRSRGGRGRGRGESEGTRQGGI